ncbi:aminodeoxychorismate synthase, component I [Domibacillus epiphyticus]|uniref:Aminodeoxychorismate synthase, component I n=1 Tax=Domibacillus epiphyticus TaxID=1714355 RepID=A0A1V2AAP4_9BACI|nr:aminodeoxychorismate synthase, component I [Domibacillus epiphyticus]OMP68076.1 aminodeoxychorismate synthase, component I [Domibacillus epiphyticus]
MNIFYRKTSYDKDQFFNQYTALTKNETHHALLESGRGGRYSFAGIHPSAIASSTDEGLLLQEKGKEKIYKGNPLHQLIRILDERKIPKREDLPDFQGGAVGWISYDYVRFIESLPETAIEDIGIPDIQFLLFEKWTAFDHHTNELYVMKMGENEDGLEEFYEQWLDLAQPVTWPSGELKEKTDVSFPEEQFKSAVEKVREYIAAGDVFQVNLSVRRSKQLDVPPLAVYAKLRELNPSPYMGYIHTPDFQVVSGSPELLVKKDGKELSTRPIAGTRSRGKDDAEDERLAAELVHNEKERAEHVMLVDLERNDLGRVSRYGTVDVNEFMVIEKYSHVMHIVSNVRGELADGKTNADVIDAVFPGGTITGAPKVRTMEIIEELEPVRRGIYTGSIGWIGFNGDMELNIVIRTMLAANGHGYVQAGAGIVIDSKPEYEYKESLKKAAAMLRAMELAEEQR